MIRNHILFTESSHQPSLMQLGRFCICWYTDITMGEKVEAALIFQALARAD